MTETEWEAWTINWTDRWCASRQLREKNARLFGMPGHNEAIPVVCGVEERLLLRELVAKVASLTSETIILPPNVLACIRAARSAIQ